MEWKISLQVAESVCVEHIGEAGSKAEIGRQAGEHMPGIAIEERGDKVNAKGCGQCSHQSSICASKQCSEPFTGSVSIGEGYAL